MISGLVLIAICMSSPTSIQNALFIVVFSARGEIGNPASHGVCIRSLGETVFSEMSVKGNAIDSGIGLSITIDKLRVFINKTLSILSAYQ